jgi:tetratricopeptide (TPR) repeat protein
LTLDHGVLQGGILVEVMNLRRLRVLSLVASLAGALSLAASSASAEGGKGDAKHKDEAAAAGSSKYREACSQGNSKYAARDFPGAIEAYRKAIELEPKNPMAHYLLGEAQLAAGSFTEADAAWNRAALESSDKDAALRAKILFVLADLRERQKKWDDAKAAWQVYLDWAAKYPNAGAFAASGQSRQQVIDAMVKQDKAYEVVRQRIADTKGGNVFTDLNKSAPPAAAPPASGK